MALHPIAWETKDFALSVREERSRYLPREQTHMTDRKSRKRVGDVAPEATRWTHVCAWDGHELEDMEYVQISPHERVCRFHYPQFQTWLRDTARTIYHVEPEEETDEQSGGVPRVFPGWRRRRIRRVRGRRRRE